MMVKGRNPAQATAIGFEPVLKPAICRRPARIASIWAALDWTGKNWTFLPVFSLRYARKSDHASA